MTAPARFQRFARGAALRAREDALWLERTRMLFDDVHALATSLESAGDFETASRRSKVEGRWSWRAYLEDELDEQAEGRPPAPGGAFLHAYA